MNEAFRRARIRLNQVVWGVVLVALSPVPDVLERLFPRRGRRYCQRVLVRVVPRLMRAVGIEIAVIGVTPPESQRCVYVCNHRTVFDPLVLFGALGDVRLVANGALFDLPILGRVLRNMGTVPVDTNNPRASIASFAALARAGLDQSIVVFPEGHLRNGPRLLPFQTGAFFLAIEASVPVVPVVVEGTGDVFGVRHSRPRVPSVPPTPDHRNSSTRQPHSVRWPGLRARLRPLLGPTDGWNAGRVVVRVLEPISTEGLTAADRRALGDRARRTMEAALVSDNDQRTPSRMPDARVTPLAR